MSFNGFKQTQSLYRPWFQHAADNGIGHSSPQHSDDDESAPEDDNVPMDYTGYAEPDDVGDDEYEQAEEVEEEGPGHDEQHHIYAGAPYNLDADHVAHDGPFPQPPYVPPPAYPNSAYLEHDSEDSDGGGTPVHPVNILSIANIIHVTNDVDMEEAFEAAFNDHFSDPQQPLHEDADDSLYYAAEMGSAGDIALPELASDIVDDEYYQEIDQLDQLGPGDEFDDGSTVWFPVPPLPAFVGPNMSNLNPGNYPLVEFLKQWSFTGLPRSARGKAKVRGGYPWPQRVIELSETHLTHVQYADLALDRCDIQGIDWADLKVTRDDARDRRRLTYRNYTNQEGSDAPDPRGFVRNTDSFFRFRRMDIRRNVHLSHFQLRNVLAATSKTRMFYTGSGLVHRFNPMSGESKTVIKMAEAPYTQISTLAADHGVLVAGGFNGEYMLRPAESDSEDDSSRSYDGVLTSAQSGITNHVQLFLSRQSSSPRAAFASNDQVVRVLDIETKKYMSEEAFADPINCTAISPDRRLRVMVGDSNKVFITAAESTLGSNKPEILQQLDGHRDFGFACDWADDGWTVATGFQDRLINIWDARRWTDSSGRAVPVETMRTEMAGARSLHFSPIGSGKRVLVAAEEADYVNIIDAQTFRTKQTIDIFGEIGGATFTNDGQDLVVLCTDQMRGGLIQLERCGLGAEASWDPDENPASLPSREIIRQRGRTFDWPVNHHNEWKVVRESDTKRRRKAAQLDGLEPF
ncbi:WD40-repeat-containing domain protein [Coniochaeta sp. 2T2.1]|nr:WD40-repeat-containing domain protein [Coniochaeta sp. 2T2.1]